MVRKPVPAKPAAPVEPLSLERLAERLDEPASEKLPEDLIRHLRLQRFPADAPAKETLSRPKGYAPRLLGTPNLPIARGEAMAIGSAQLPARREDRLRGFRPKHLDIRSLPRTVPSVDPLGGVGGMKPMVHIIGQDLGAFPWSAIGKVHVMAGGSAFQATGFMVGPNLLMTASHVMPWEYSGNCSIRFVPAEYPGREPPFGEAWVSDWHGFRYEGGLWDQLFKPQARDYVICRLHDPIGNVCGWLGTQSFKDSDRYRDLVLMSAGYPDFADYYPTVELLATIRDVDGDNDARELETVNFASFGWSGGPLFGYVEDDWRAVGVCSGKETEFVVGIPPWNVNCVFAGGQHLVDLVQYGYDNYLI